MRILFAGTPAVAVPSLIELAKHHEVVGVLTRAAKPQGRKRVLVPSAVAQAAQELGIEVYTPATLKSEESQQLIESLHVDAVAVVAYGKIVPQSLLDVPKHGWLNLHFSTLPRWRGAAPVQYAIAAGDETIGISIFRIDAGLDTGKVALQVESPMPIELTSGELLEQLAVEGAEKLVEVFSGLETGEIEFREQVGEPSFAPSLTTENSGIEWDESAREIERKIRAYTPEPGAWSTYGDVRVRILPVKQGDDVTLRAAEASDRLALTREPGTIVAGKRVYVWTGEGAVELVKVIPAGKKEMDAAAWVRGLRDDQPKFARSAK